MNTNQQIPKIVKLLWDGKTSKAKKLITLESARLEAQATELKEALAAVEADITTMHSLTPQSDQMSSGEAGQQAAQFPRLTLAQKEIRHTEILNAADAILQDKEEFTVLAVAEILLESGVVMGVPENRITTAISEIAEPLIGAGHQLVVLTSPSVRAQVKQILDNHLPNSIVLSYNEIVRDLDVESHGLVQLPQEEFAPVGAA